MATLLPWNFFITPFAYWMSKLTIANATDVDVDGDSTEEGVAAAVAMTEAVANVTAVVLNTLKEDRSALGLPADPDSGNQRKPESLMNNDSLSPVVVLELRISRRSRVE